ncbi:MAG TPA: hypothetical protein PKY88_11055 [Anaerohalosphaeraceae bacterium]|nr:hypothetical protein [Anaerohalosphaeraceae bacterium]
MSIPKNCLRTIVLGVFLTALSGCSPSRPEENAMVSQDRRSAGFFPTVTGRNLTGQSFTFPDNLRKDYNLIAVAFLRQQQADVDTWIAQMEPLEAQLPSFAFFEVPTIRKMNPFSRWFIYQGMRGGIPSQAARQRTVTLHIDKEPFKKALGIESEETIYLFLTDRTGKILWQTSGSWSEDKHQQLLAVLNPSL